MRWGLLSLLQTFELDDDGTCANCGEDEGDHVGEGKRCPVIQYFSPFSWLCKSQRCVWSRCGFRSLYTNEFWQCLRRMLCASCTSDTHFQRRIVVISVVNSQYVSFRIPPKLIVHLPQSMLECAFNDAYSMLPNLIFNLCLNVVSMLSVACVLAVNFKVYTLSNSDNVCDECCVLTWPRTRISDDYSWWFRSWIHSA